jgi:hypothetical protein
MTGDLAFHGLAKSIDEPPRLIVSGWRYLAGKHDAFDLGQERDGCHVIIM